MTETRVIIDLDREATPDQMMALQDGVEASLDHVVGDTLVPDRGYAGMLATYVGTVVTIGAGRLYSGSKVYAFDTAQSFDALAAQKLPVATKRIMLIVAYGTEADTDVAPVNFLVESLSTPAAPVYKPQTVATMHRRLAVVQADYGDEAPNPAYPGYGLALPIAVAVLTPTGIASLTNIVGGQVPNLADIARRTAALETFEAVIGPEVSSLASDLASLANSLKSNTSQALIGRMLVSIADLDAKVGIPANAADSDSDYLLTDANSDVANPLYLAKTMEGIRFADDGADDQVPNLFNPFETAGMVKGGVLFPAYDRYLRTTTGPATGNVQANSYTYNPVTYTQKTMARTRVRYGTEFTVCSNSAFWNSGSYDPITGVFELPSGETFKVGSDVNVNEANFASVGYALHEYLRLEQFWTDTVDTNYWDAVIQAPQVIAGFHLAESFLVGQDQWLDAVGVTFAKLDAQGDVTLLVCEADTNAAPDPDSVLGQVTVPFASLAAGAETLFALATPVLLTGGKRISIVVVTTGAHAVATTDGKNFPQGTFFVLSPSGYAQGDLTKHLCLNLYGAKFRAAAVSIQLQNLQLAGGMTSIDILAGAVVPGSTNLIYEVQLAGLWTALSGTTIGLLNSGGNLPPNVPIRATFVGSPDMMPALDLDHANIHVSRPRTTLKHIWPLGGRTPPAPTSQVRVIQRYESYDPAFHAVSVSLLTGAGFATATAPSSFSDAPTDDGALVRTYVFNLGAAVTAYKVQTSATTTTALKTFHVAWIKDYVL